MDLDYFRQVAPVTDDILNILIAAGWALLLGNMVFQATKSMATGLGFEGEDPKLLFTRTFVFAFLLLASQQICGIGLGISSQVIELLQLPTSVTITIPDENTFSIGASWLLVIIVGIVIMWQFVKLCFEVAERYVVTAILVILSPLAFAMGGSKNTQDIFKGWCRMFGSMCVMMVLNVVFLKLLISALGYVPSGVAVLPWMLLIVGIARVARKIDGIIARLGLNPAITGDGLGRGLPGMVAYAVVKGIGSSIVKAAGSSAGKNQTRGSHPGGNTSGPRANPQAPPPPTPPPPGGTSGGAGVSAGAAAAGHQGDVQPGARSSAYGGTYASSQTVQGVEGSSSGSHDDSHGSGPAKQDVPPAGQGAGKPHTSYTQRARRTSVPPEARAGTRTAQGYTAAFATALGAEKQKMGTVRGGAEPSVPTGSSPYSSISHQQGPTAPPGRSGEAGGTPKGGTRLTSVQIGQGTGSSTSHTSHTSARETVREQQPIQQDRTPKIPAPPGVGAGDKGEARPSGMAGMRSPASDSRPHLGGDAASAGMAATRPPIGGRHHSERGGPPPSGTAGKPTLVESGIVPGGAVSSSAMAGTHIPPIDSRPSGGGRAVPSGTAGKSVTHGDAVAHVSRFTPPSGTAGTVHTIGGEQPFVGGGTPASAMAGTRRPSAVPQTGPKAPPSGTAGTTTVGDMKAPGGANRGTSRIKKDALPPSMSGGRSKPPKSRRKRSDQ